MDSFAKYTIIDWIAFLQVLLIWFYMAYRSGQWIVSVACSKGWRWWNLDLPLYFQTPVIT